MSLAGSVEKFRTGSVNNVTVEGNRTILQWGGPDKGAILDRPSPSNGCVRRLRITGERGTHWKKVIAVRHRDGIERQRHGGKNNRIEDLMITTWESASKSVACSVRIWSAPRSPICGSRVCGLAFA